jgi:alpha-galactosidase
VWSAKLHDGSYVVALYNLDATPANVTAHLGDLGIKGPVRATDVWQHSTMPVTSGSITRDLPAHGSALFRVRAGR